MRDWNFESKKIEARQGLPFFHVSVERMENWLPLLILDASVWGKGKKKTLED